MGNKSGKTNIKDIKVTKESDSGRNLEFKNTKTGEELSRAQVVNKIESGEITGAHVRKVNNVKTPCSNPDGKKNNNLG
ncbi:hypothetical protein HNP87_001410 [Methanococcus maripaludis]|nr:DUF3892 domain-containing protein [Methanococcus maripaludis]MBA2840878.1 hypothetical protein [Methanococcus maripaludis]MBA2861059.1 hypothetical protein [Methanococcus maripaludis]MBA2868948.1 hypothetical protein [Methanococcus maripaludis]MBB6401600.1 hypothetical protein [Methanococcus maripaludis]